MAGSDHHVRPGTTLGNTGYIIFVSAYDVWDGGIAPLFSGPISITEGAFVFLEAIYEEPINLELEVQIDVKPGSDPTIINMCSNGKVPVAVLSDEVFDATQVLPETVEFAGAGVAVCGRNKYMARAEDVNMDGYDDMVFHFRTKDLQPEEGVTRAALTLIGQFMSQDYLVTISGTEDVYLLWPKKKWSHAFVNNGLHYGKHRRHADCDRPDKDKKPRGKK